ncbi:hypothetical protein [Longispora albida]|uniref:hypothetical protein n=1 Tax=Longispora albida TaxID=203523 RepID=UPI000362AEB9|nr:hypothetical protein [Longispora albida]
MTDRIDALIGPLRRRRLVEAHGRRLRRQDLLPHAAARALAAEAYDRRSPYVLAAPGQTWRLLRGTPRTMRIDAVQAHKILGRMACCTFDDGETLAISLGDLDTRFELLEWP